MANGVNVYKLGPQYLDYCIDELGHIFHPTKKNRCLDNGEWSVKITEGTGIASFDRYEMYAHYLLGIPKKEIGTRYKMVLMNMLKGHESFKTIKEQTVHFYRLNGKRTKLVENWFRKVNPIGCLEADYIFRKHSSIPTCVLDKDIQDNVNADWIERLHNYPDHYIFCCDSTNNYQVINLKKNEIVEVKSLKGKRVFRMPVNRVKYCEDINVKYVAPHDSCVPYEGLDHLIHPTTPANILPSWIDDDDLMYPSSKKGGD